MRYREPIERGEIDLTFRRWKRCQVVVGNRYRTAAGRLQVEAVDVVNPARITKAEAKRAGFASPEECRKFLRGDDSIPVYRIRFHAADGPDERSELAANDALAPDDVADISNRLARARPRERARFVDA